MARPFFLFVFAFTVAAASAAVDSGSRAVYLHSPLRFEANLGQTGAAVRFLAHTPGYNLFLMDEEAVVSARGSAVRLRFTGAAQAKPEPLGLLPGRTNYYIGNDPARWRRGIPAYGKVRYRGLYPGVDLVYYGNQRRLEYDLVVAPGADPSRIRMKVSGGRLRLEGGDLLIGLGAAELRLLKPRVYQDGEGGRREIAGAYVLGRGGEVRFKVGRYDKARPLTIDPTLAGLWYNFGQTEAAGEDYLRSMKYRKLAGQPPDLLVGGETTTPTFPVSSGGRTYQGQRDIFIAVLDPATGQARSFTYLGGSSDDYLSDVADGFQGGVVFTGYTFSSDFPTTANAYQPTPEPPGTASMQAFPNSPKAAPPTYSSRAIVAQLDHSNAMVGSTYLGGLPTSTSKGVSLVSLTPGATNENAKRVVVAGVAQGDFPNVNGTYQTTHRSGQDIFLAALNANLSTLHTSTLIGGGGADTLNGFQGSAVVDGDQPVAVLSGTTESGDFPVQNAIQSEHGSIPVFKLNTSDYTITPFKWNNTSATAISSVTTDSAGTLFASTNTGVATSTDGVQWTELSTPWQGLATAVIYCGDDHWAASGSNVYVSGNKGVDWTQTAPLFSDGQNSATVRTLAGGGGGSVYAGVSDYSGSLGGVYKTTGPGQSWIRAGLDGQNVYQIISNPQNPNSLVARTYDGLQGSSNGGDSWTPYDTSFAGSNKVWSLGWDPYSGTLYTSVLGGASPVYRSTDGAHWTPAGGGTILGVPDTFGFAPGGIVVAASSEGAYQSADDGLTWQAVGDGVQPHHTSAIVTAPGSNDVLLFQNAPQDGFVTTVDVQTGQVQSSTFFGGAGNDTISGVSVDSSGRTYVTGNTYSRDFSFSQSLTGANSYWPAGFVARTNQAGSGWNYVTNIGPGNPAVVRAHSPAWIVGRTFSTGLPVTADRIQAQLGGGADAFAMLLNSDGSLRFGTWLGGSAFDEATAVASDDSGNVYIGGNTQSSNLPATAGSYSAGSDIFIAKLSPSVDLAFSQSELSFSGASPASQTVNVTSTSGAAAYTATASASWLTVTPASGTTPGALTIGVDTAGLSSGTHTATVNITAGDNTSRITVTVTVPGPTITGVAHSASGSLMIAPNSFVTFYGSGFTTGQPVTWDGAIPDGVTLPRTLAGLSVKINGKDAWPSYVSGAQVNALTPWDTAVGTVQVELTTAEGTARTIATMAAAEPGFFCWTVLDKLRPVALLGNERVYVLPENAAPGITSRPAKAQDVLVLFAAGLGATATPVPQGQVLAVPYAVDDLSRVQVTINGVQATTLYAGMTFAGLFQLNVEVPAGLPEGDLPVVLTVDGRSSQTNAVLTFGQ